MDKDILTSMGNIYKYGDSVRGFNVLTYTYSECTLDIVRKSKNITMVTMSSSQDGRGITYFFANMEDFRRHVL